MKLSVKTLIACAGLAALAACAAEEPAALGPSVNNDQTKPALNGEQIRSLIVGQTATGPISGSHIMFKMYVAADGTATADRPTGIEHGTWHVADNQWCVRWENYRAGQEYCERVYPNGANYKFVNTTMEDLFTFQPGNQIGAPTTG
jgi:hypothetical protein